MDVPFRHSTRKECSKVVYDEGFLPEVIVDIFGENMKTNDAIVPFSKEIEMGEDLVWKSRETWRRRWERKEQ